MQSKMTSYHLDTNSKKIGFWHCTFLLTSPLLHLFSLKYFQLDVPFVLPVEDSLTLGIIMAQILT